MFFSHGRVGDGPGHVGGARARHAHNGDMKMGLRDVVEQVAEGTAGQRMREVGGDLHGGLENETARRHPWMGNRQRRAIHHLVIDHQFVIEEQIEIHRPRPPSLAAVAVERVLDRGERAEKFVWTELVKHGKCFNGLLDVQQIHLPTNLLNLKCWHLKQDLPQPPAGALPC